MKDFLSSIDIGVFDLDEVLQSGFSNIVPARFRNEAKTEAKKYKNFRKEYNVLQKLANKGMGTLSDALKKKINDAQADDSTKSKSAKERLLDREINSKSFTGRIKNFGTTGIGRTTIGVASMALASVQKTFSNISQTVDETGFFSSKLLEDFDAIGKRSRDMVINNERLYNSIDDNFETFVKFRREFGNTEDISIRVMDNISQMENIIGLSNEEAIALLKTFRGINRENAETNTQLIQTASMLSSSNNIAFRDVMQDITDNAGFFSTYMSDSSDKVAEMVVRSRRLGVEFGTFSTIFESFSGIESALESQARTSIFADTRMDFLGVLEDLQSGKVQDAMSSIMDQIGGISQSRFDNPFVKKQLSEGFGVDVETLSRLRREATGNMTVDDELKKSMVEFNENFKQLGFATLKKDFIQFVINPISNLLKNNTTEMQSIFNAIGGIIKAVGGFTTGAIAIYSEFMSFIEEKFGETWASLGTLITGIGTIFGAYKASNFFEAAQLNHLRSIDMKLTGALSNGRMSDYFLGKSYPSSSGGRVTTRGGRVRKGGGRAGGLLASNTARGIGGAVALLGSGYAGYQDDKKDGVETGSLLATMIATGTAGAIYGMAGGAGGILGGAAIGGAIGGIGYTLGDSLNSDDSQKLGRGGIFTKRHTGKFDVAETGKPEGFVPLEIEDGKPTMPVNLSNDTIKKLAGAMSKIKFMGNVKVDGAKNNKMDFYSHVMQPSSSLNV